MNEYEILNLSGQYFINNAMYTLAVVIMTFVSFRIARVARDKNASVFGKVLVTIFGACNVFFGLQVSSYLVLQQKSQSFQLSELLASGVEISTSSKAIIKTMGHTVADGVPSLAPGVTGVILWVTVALLIIGITWLDLTKKEA